MSACSSVDSGQNEAARPDRSWSSPGRRTKAAIRPSARGGTVAVMLRPSGAAETGVERTIDGLPIFKSEHYDKLEMRGAIRILNVFPGHPQDLEVHCELIPGTVLDYKETLNPQRSLGKPNSESHDRSPTLSSSKGSKNGSVSMPFSRQINE